MSENKVVSGKATSLKHDSKKHHTPSTIQADTLFTFTSKPDYLIADIKRKMLSPRYCEEDVSYLKIPNLKKIAYPMKCFCDINMHRLDVHLEWYGYYGLAFSKEWGMYHGIQPIQYINPDSALCKDFSMAFSAALKAKPETETKLECLTKSFLLHEMMYYKPYAGITKNRNTSKKQKKCFTDECEWRFIPNVQDIGYSQAYYDENFFDDGVLVEISNSLAGIESISLQFEYTDIKYIIIKNTNDFEKLVTEISKMQLSSLEEHQLISKIIVWENSKGDF